MRLIKLSSNKESFQTVNFNKVGISLITALQRTTEKKKTYNSVGKSLMISILHFCLGANATADFVEKLVEWEFTLEFELQDEVYIVTRSTSNYNFVLLNGVKFSIIDFKELMGSLVFYLSNSQKPLSFRSLISRFIRQNRNSYDDYFSFVNKERPEVELLSNAYLLGLSTELILNKIDIKNQIDNITSLIKKLKVDPVIKSYFYGEESDEDVNSKVEILKRKANKLQSDLDKFKISENYHNLEKEVNYLKTEIKGLSNLEFRIKDAINFINKSLDIDVDLDIKDLEKLYSETKIHFPKNVNKTLKQVQSFNTKLIVDRFTSLEAEKKEFEKKLNEIVEKKISNSKKYDKMLGYLKNAGALEDYTALSRELNDLLNQINKFDDFKKLLKEYKNRKEENLKEFTNQNIITNNYLDEIKEIISKNISTFQSLAENFYKDKPTGIFFENNIGKNKKRFNIEAKIISDSGDAVNLVKIFCFDWTILLGEHNHNVKFLVHDSRITDGIDTRQVASIFSTAYEYCKNYDLQYVIAANQNVLDSLKNELSDDDYQTYITNNVILNLSDESPSSKLLGIDLDLKYEPATKKAEDFEDD